MNKKVEKTTESISSEKRLPILEQKLKKKHYRKALQIIYKYKVGGYTVTKTRLKNEYKLSSVQIKKLNYIEVTNPHYKTSSPMKLYLIKEITDKFPENEF